MKIKSSLTAEEQARFPDQTRYKEGSVGLQYEDQFGDNYEIWFFKSIVECLPLDVWVLLKNDKYLCRLEGAVLDLMLQQKHVQCTVCAGA